MPSNNLNARTGLIVSLNAISFSLFLTAFCGYIAYLFIPTITPSIANDLSVDVVSIGVVTGLQAALAGLSCMLAATAVAVLGRKKTLLISLYLTAVFFSLCAFSTEFWTFATFASLGAACYGCLGYLSLSGAAKYFSEAEQAKISARITSTLFLATAIGVPVSVGVSQFGTLSWRLSFAAVALACIITGLIVNFAIPAMDHDERKEANLNLVWEKIAIRPRFSPEQSMLLAIVFLVRFGVGMYMTYAPTYVILIRGLHPLDQVWTYSAAGISAFVISLYAGKVGTQENQHRVMAFTSAMLCVAVGMIAFFPSTKITIFYVGLASGIIYTIGESFRMTTVHRMAISAAGVSNGEYFLAIFTLVMAFAYAFGTMVGGGLIRIFDIYMGAGLIIGFPVVVLLTSAVWIIAAVVLSWLPRNSNFGS